MAALSRRPEPLGWDESAFQLWGSIHAWQPLQLPCVPLLGRYGPDYLPMPPLVVVRLPPSAASLFPEALLGGCTPTAEEDNLLLLLLVHPALAGFPEDGLVNLVLHAWALPHLADLEAHCATRVRVGVSAVEGVAPAGAACIDAASFDELQERRILVHNNCLSPNNMQLHVSFGGGRQLGAFYSVATQGDRTVAALQLLPADDAAESPLRSAATTAMDAASLRSALVPELDALGAPAAAAAAAGLLDRLIGEADQLAARYAASAVLTGALLSPPLEPPFVGPQLRPAMTARPAAARPEEEPAQAFEEEAEGDVEDPFAMMAGMGA